ncbi:BTB/POZ-like [Macleaya cordata]|uniref:BTB/POZ-like n=1 Tax=Macleaya cordata TaxID=56857 RepID=A0A200QPE9_MACCD|nr:BTB/POZ-like [Macleaya cordata]
MNDSAYRVQTMSRVAQWKIDNMASYAYMKSDPFKMGNWNWHLSVEKNRMLFIKLHPEISNLTRDHPPIASFIIRVICSIEDRTVLVHPEVTDKQLKKNDDFIWTIDSSITGKFIVEVEFTDLKTTSPNGGELCSIWADGFNKKQSDTKALAILGKMLSEGIHTDITINTSDGRIGAHRAVLAARSPVFRSMFSHNLKEMELSTIDISDMSMEACQTFLNYIYGSIKDDEFLNNRLALLHAADKYDISELKESCHDSLMQDINTENVLERLQIANLYQLPILKSSCMRYLVKFGKIFDIRDDFNDFLKCRDRELIAEVFHEVLNNWKGF